MKVVLTQNLPNVGKSGDVVDVKSGYARNFLIPQSLAMNATETVLKHFEERKRAFARKEAKLLTDAQDLAKQLEEITLTHKAKVGEEGKLYGTVTVKEVAQALADKGFTVDRKQLEIKTPIKVVGEHMVTAKLHTKVIANVKLNVEASA